MKYFLFILLLSGSRMMFAQEGYSITYGSGERFFPITINGERRPMTAITDRLVFDDSLSFWYRLFDGRDPFRKNTLLGNKVVHHAMLYNAKTSIYYSEVAWPQKSKPYLVYDSIKNDDWLFLNDTKKVLGYNCRLALYVNDKNDSTRVWFTDSIPRPFGPFMYFGFPGVVLEVKDPARGWHLTAVKIVKGPYQVVMPKEVAIISSKEYISPKKK